MVRNNAGIRPAKEGVFSIDLHLGGIIAHLLSVTLLCVTGVLFVGLLTHYCIYNWISDLPTSRWLAASAAMFVSAQIIAVIVLTSSTDYLGWWPINENVLVTLALLWFPLTLVVGIVVARFFPFG